MFIICVEEAFRERSVRSGHLHPRQVHRICFIFFPIKSLSHKCLLLGPLIGGAFAASNYRWLFYMNLPLTAIVIAIVALFMNLKTPPGTIREKLRRMDWYIHCSVVCVTH